MKCTSFGSYFRMLRLRYGEVLQDAGRFLGVTAAYISAVECGKRPVPAEWEEKIAAHYGLTEEERAALHKATDLARSEVRIPLDGASDICKAAALRFANAFATLDDATAQGLLSVLDGNSATAPASPALAPAEKAPAPVPPAPPAEEKRKDAPAPGASATPARPVPPAPKKAAPKTVPPQIKQAPGEPPIPPALRAAQTASSALPEEDDRVRTLVSKEGFPAGTIGAVVGVYEEDELCDVELWDRNEFPVGIVTYRFSEITLL